MGHATKMKSLDSHGVKKTEFIVHHGEGYTQFGAWDLILMTSERRVQSAS